MILHNATIATPLPLSPCSGMKGCNLLYKEVSRGKKEQLAYSASPTSKCSTYLVTQSTLESKHSPFHLEQAFKHPNNNFSSWRTSHSGDMFCSPITSEPSLSLGCSFSSHCGGAATSYVQMCVLDREIKLRTIVRVGIPFFFLKPAGK